MVIFIILGLTDKIFKLVSSDFSFHDVIFFSHVIPLLWLWLKSIHFKIENALSELKGQIIILRVGTYLLFYSTTTVKQCFHSQKYGQKITGSTTETNWKSVY